MKAFATTRMSSKGQVVIPEEIRKILNLTEGNQFVVLGEKDLTPPARKDFEHLVTQARLEAKRAGIKKSDVKKIIKKVRKEKE